MRELILKRLQAIKEEEKGFRGPGRWSGWNFNPNRWERAQTKHKKNVHLSQLEFGQVPDQQLLVIFESIIRHKNKQM